MPPKRLSLPGNLLKEMGVSTEGRPSRDTNRWKSQGQNRKDRRKAERSTKRQKITISNRKRNRSQTREKSSGDELGLDELENSTTELPPPTPSRSRDGEKKRKRDDMDDEDDQPPKLKRPTKATRDKLAQDDAEIAALERKLGIKGRKKLPKIFHDDGLGSLLDDVGEDGESSDERSNARAEADEWLASKRQKATKRSKQSQEETDEEEDDDVDGNSDFEDDLTGFDNDSEDDLGDKDEVDGEGDDGESSEQDSFGGFEASSSDAEEIHPKSPRVRENPYIAPVATTDAAKYIPPSLRKSFGKDSDLEAQVRRKTQGPVNRVTEANLISIIGEIEKIYREYPRGIVTDILTDLLMAQICDPTSKPDTLLVLSAGFIAALYKIIGIDFAARCVQTMVERFERQHELAQNAVHDGRAPTKETSNLITVLSEMYMFRVIGSNLLFDYVRLLLADLSELNAELLLRIVRMAGPQLRKDDPLALKDIVSLIRPAVAKIGDENLTVRTKFMIETISDLKNNKTKAGSQDLAILNEHVTRMRKLLGTMETAKVKATEPLRVGLQDIKNADKTGKWWLVGASWGGRQDTTTAGGTSQTAQEAVEEDDDVSDQDLNLAAELDVPDFAKLAREQGMNTDVRRAIFIALVAAADVQDAYLRILKLRLNKYNRREIANVLVQCSGAQEHYNPYYTLVSSKFCADSRIRYSFQDALWALFRRLGEPLFGEEPEDEDEEAAEDRRLINTAKLFGNLILDSSLGLGVLKPLNLAYAQGSTSLLVEVMLITVLQGSMKHKTKTVEQRLAKVFAVGLPSDLARSIRYFMQKKVRSSDLVSGKQVNKLKEACRLAERMLEERELAAEE